MSEEQSCEDARKEIQKFIDEISLLVDEGDPVCIAIALALNREDKKEIIIMNSSFLRKGFDEKWLERAIKSFQNRKKLGV